MLIIFQVIFLLFVLFVIWGVWGKRGEGFLGPKAAIFWTIFWLLVALVVIWPGSVQIVANYLGIGRGADFVIYVSIALIFYLLFRFNIKTEGLRRDLTAVAREEALHSTKEKDN